MFGWLTGDAAKEPIPPKKMGDYYKFFHCPDCGYAVHDRDIKRVECCKECGGEHMRRVVGRWEYEFEVFPYWSGYVGIKFHPKESRDEHKKD